MNDQNKLAPSDSSLPSSGGAELRVMLRNFVIRERALIEAQGKGGQTVGYSPSITPSVLRTLERMLQLAEPTPPAGTSTAERIARQAHAGQKDTVIGADYITHIERVVAMVEGEDAWLHDVIEDTDVSYGELRRAGIPERIIDAVRLVTREDPYEYALYIEQIRQSGNALALAVKIADLRDHLRPNCPARLRPRYECALQSLANTESDPSGWDVSGYRTPPTGEER